MDRWAIDMRNMLVHRPRRTWTARIDTESVAGGATAKTRLLLPKEPDLSSVEAMRDLFEASLLSEPAERTMTGVLSSTECLVEAMCGRHTRHWNLGEPIRACYRSHGTVEAEGGGSKAPRHIVPRVRAGNGGVPWGPRRNESQQLLTERMLASAVWTTAIEIVGRVAGRHASTAKREEEGEVASGP